MTISNPFPWAQRTQEVRRRLELSWWQEHAGWRWGVPAVLATISAVVVGHGMSSTDPQFQAVSMDLGHRDVPAAPSWLQRFSAMQAAVSAWQLAQTPPGEDLPAVNWPQRASAVGWHIQRLRWVSSQTQSSMVQHNWVLEGQGDVQALARFWRRVAQDGDWVTPVSMRMTASTPDSPGAWEAKWVLHRWAPMGPESAAVSAIGTDAQVHDALDRWLNLGPPSVTHAIEHVPWPDPDPEAESSAHGPWSLANAHPLSVDTALWTWPRVPWDQMRLVGRLGQGEQVVALVAQGQQVHAVRLGQSLGVSAQQVLRIDEAGLWVDSGSPEPSPQRVLGWSSNEKEPES